MLKRGMMILVLAAAVAAAFAGAGYQVEPDKCSGCGDCEKVCPVDAVTIEDGVFTHRPGSLHQLRIVSGGVHL